MNTLILISTIISSLVLLAMVIYVAYQKHYMVSEATIRAYEKLQRDVFWEEKYNPQRLSEQYLDGGGSRDAMRYLVQIEHFCLGVTQGVYSFKLLKRMAGEDMVEQYTLWVPFIIAKRTRIKRTNMFCEFEKVAKRINGIRYEK